MFCDSLVCLCLLLQRYVEVAKAACSCQRDECNSEQEGLGQYFLEKKKQLKVYKKCVFLFTTLKCFSVNDAFNVGFKQNRVMEALAERWN